MGDKGKLDNIEAQKADLLNKIADNAQQKNEDSLISKPEQPEKKEEVSSETKSEESKAQEDKNDPKYDGKSVEDLIEMNREAQRKITELSQKSATEKDEKEEGKSEGKSSKKVTFNEDALETFKNLFNAPQEQSTQVQHKELDKTQSQIEDDDDLSDSDKSSLLKEVRELRALINADRQEAKLSQAVEQERKQARDKLKNDKVLPWTDEVEDMIEENIFANMPKLKTSKGGYIVAHTLLKGLVADGSVEPAKQSDSSSEESPQVAQPTKARPEQEYDPSTEKDPAKLRDYLLNNTGVARNYNR